MVQASVYEALVARFESGEADVLPVLVDALLEGVEGRGGHFGQVMTRATKRGGVMRPSEPVPNSYALVVPGKSITLIGIRELVTGATPYVKVFKLGDVAEYDSYNMSFYGPIESIGAKTVTISDDRKRARLDIETFAWRNSRFNLEKARARNIDVMMNM